MKLNRREIRKKKHAKIRQKIIGTVKKPRLCVFRSNQHIYAQVIDDSQGRTIIATSTLDKTLDNKDNNSANCQSSAKVGELLAKKSLEKGIFNVVFDRSGYFYHGRIKSLADSARTYGLQF
uniref:ribosomal protein L18 n=1 Tax=Glaucosphaera vacuolata TaxID=38265 RepID=UPI001FCD1291|nr:ribosomal protein L18 [Glaucosphaera vacuolata]UNJ18723.1 ribosomal protein L18 [Glaucosphaera vacuolata]